MEKSDDIKHIVRNGLVVIQIHARMQGKLVDQILRRCKEIEEALDKVERDENER